MDFCNPDHMFTEDLINVLIERQLQIPNIRDLSRDRLIQIYRKFILPLEQRSRNRNGIYGDSTGNPLGNKHCINSSSNNGEQIDEPNKAVNSKNLTKRRNTPPGTTGCVTKLAKVSLKMTDEALTKQTCKRLHEEFLPCNEVKRMKISPT